MSAAASRSSSLDLKPLTRNYLAFQVFFALLFWLPVFYEVQKRMGLGESEIFGIQSFYYLLFCLLELPTGWLADRFGLIRSLRWGAVALVAAHLVVVSGDFGVAIPAYWTFWSHFALIALARSLISGASNAYLYEAYTRAGRGAEYVHVEGRARAYGLFTKIISWAGIGYLTEKMLLGSYWLSLGSALIAVWFAWRLQEGQWEAEREARNRGSSLWNALLLVFRERRLLGLMIQGMGVFVLARLVQVNLFQPILLSRGFTTASLGWMMALMTAAEAIASLRLRVVLARMRPVDSVTILTAALAVVVALFSIIQGGMVIVGLVVFSMLVGFVGPIQRQVINGAITDSSHRAVLLSLESLLDRAATSGVAYLLGIFMAQGRMNLFLILSGLAFLMIAGVQMAQAMRSRAPAKAAAASAVSA
jgi:MFS family permease